MCSISGCLTILKKSQHITKKLKQLIINAESRGRDSFGVVFIDYDNKFHVVKAVGKPSDSIDKIRVNAFFKIAINNNRAEPTTEYVKNKTVEDIQPFFNESIVVSHNGTIANDKELEKKYDLKRKTKIDSAILPPLLTKIWDGKSGVELARILREEIIGSYALAIWDIRSPDKLWLATNYKPLFIFWDGEDTIFFTSLEEYLSERDYNDIFQSSKTMEIQPYTLLEVSLTEEIKEYSLWNKDYEQNKKEKALIIASSGLDSTVCASWSQMQGYETILLHFKYSCRAEKKEIEAIRKIAKELNCELIEIEVNFFKNVIKHSRLTNPETSGDIVKTGEGEASAELALEWVPARNLIFMSIATGYAEANKIDYIILGGNLEESGAYPDNELIFQKKFNSLLPNALNLQNRVRVLTPVANLMKHEIVKLGLSIKSPLHLAWSCYEGDDIHCGSCGPCLMRRVGFQMNKKKDIIPYKFIPPKFWEDCNE